MTRTLGLLLLALALATLRAALPAPRALALELEPLPDPPPDASVLEAPPCLSAALDGLRSGATPWLLAAQAIRAELEAGSPAPHAQLQGLVGALPWDAVDARPVWLLPETSPGLHPLQVAGLRGTLAVSAQADGRRGLALGARGGAWQLVVSARGRLATGAQPALELTADIGWTRPGPGPERARTWAAWVTTAAGDPLRAADGARAGGTLRVSVTAPDGRSGELALELAPGGLRARGRWPAAGGLDEEIATAGDRIVVQARAPRDRPAHRVELCADGGPLVWRAVTGGPAGRVASLIDGRLESADGPAGTWQDLAAEPPAAGVFHLVAGALLVVGDHLGRTVTTGLPARPALALTASSSP